MVGVYGLGIGVFQRILIWLYSGPVGSGVVIWGSILGYFDQITYPLMRARAYNDVHKDAVLLKTASNGAPQIPQNGPILGSQN